MPLQRSSAGNEPQRLAHVFVRVPTGQRQKDDKPTTAPQGQQMKVGSSKTTSTSTSPTSAPLTPHHPAKDPHLPPTPSPTPTKSTLKRAAADTHGPDPEIPSLKRHRPNLSPSYRSPAPKFSLAHQIRESSSRKSQGKEGRDTVSWQELKRAAESVMRQVDWVEVAEYVAGNRSAGVYKRVVREVLQEGIEELAKREE